MNSDEGLNKLSQISINGETKLYGVIGNPIKHSFSPKMQSLAFQECGFNAVYLPFLIQENQLPQLLNAFIVSGVQGFNITLPFKEKIVPYLDILSDEAAVLQSVNTVIQTPEGWKGYSTDGNGFIRSLTAADISLKGKRILLAGAGGAARAIAVSLALAGVSDLVITNRTQKKADNLAELLRSIIPKLNISTFLPSDLRTDIIINTTSVGMYDNGCALPDTVLDSCEQVVDIIYNPPMTPLLKKAAERSISYMNGIDMLLYQGVEAFEIWTGHKAPVESMRQSLIDSVYSGTATDNIQNSGS